MTFSRLISVIHLLYDVAAIILLVGGIAPLDAPDPIRFIIYIAIFLVTSIVTRIFLTAGGQGLEKSESGAVAFEAIFRYTTIKGLFIALFRGENVKFKVTDKTGVKGKDKKKSTEEESDDGESSVEKFDEDARTTVLGRRAYGQPAHGMRQDDPGTRDIAGDGDSSAQSAEQSDRQSTVSTAHEDMSSSTMSEDEYGRSFKKNLRSKTPEERAQRRRDIRKNLLRIWFNILMAGALAFAIVWGIINPPTSDTDDVVVVDGVRGRNVNNNLLPLAMALGFAMANLLPHLLAIYLCFIPYVSGWVMSDLVHGRCDQYAVHPKTGKLFVPWSFISLLTVAKFILIFGSMAALTVYTLISDGPKFVPLTPST